MTVTLNSSSLHNVWQEEDKKGFIMKWSLSTRKKPGHGNEHVSVSFVPCVKSKSKSYGNEHSRS